MLIRPGELPPTLPEDCLEEWLWQPATAIELANRAALLRLRTAAHEGGPSVRADGELSFHGHSSVANPEDVAVLQRLAAKFERAVPEPELIDLLPRADLHTPLALRACVTRLRRRLRPIGLQIERVPNIGYRLTAL